jgi:hypothetical protein
MSAATQWAAILATVAVLWFAFVAARPWRRRWPRSPVAIVVAAGWALVPIAGWAIAAVLAFLLVYAATHALVGPPAATLLGAVPAVAGGALVIRSRRRRQTPRMRRAR